MSKRKEVFREIAEALLDRGLSGSCHGCSNVGDDALLWLKEKFPDDLDFVEQVAGEDGYDKEARIKDD